MTREMKDSGVEWIGKIPSECSVVRCKYISKTFNGYAFNSNDFTREYKYSVLRIGDIFNGRITSPSELGVNFNKGLGTSRIKKNDILLAMSGATVGKVGLFFNETESYANQRVGIIRSQYQIYLYYVLNTKSFLDYIFLKANGSAQPNVSLSDFGNFYVPLPLDRDVKIIANYLDRKCAEIDNLTADIEKQISLLEDYKKSIIAETVTKGLNPNVEMKDSEVEWIGKIPKHWIISKIKHIAKINPKCYIRKLNSNSVVTYSPMECIRNNTFENRPINYEELPPSLTRFQEGDLVMAKVSPCFENGNISIMKDLYSGVGFGSSELFVFRTNPITTRYLCYFLQNTNCKNYEILSFSGIAGLQRINSDHLRNTNITIPNINEQKQIADYLDKKCSEIDSLIEEKKEQLEKLASYKQSMIYEYVTGKKEVPTQEIA